MRIWHKGENVGNPIDAVVARVVGPKRMVVLVAAPGQQNDDFTASLAPGNDLAGFLTAARNVRALERPGVEAFAVQRYAFDLTGPLLADDMRTQLEDQLRRDGKLPAGLRLSSVEQCCDAMGRGEVWIEPDGLPLRLTVEMAYPQQRNGERVEAQISTDFSNLKPLGGAAGLRAEGSRRGSEPPKH